MRVVHEAHSLYILVNPENPVALCLLCNVGGGFPCQPAAREDDARAVFRPGSRRSYSSSRFMKRSNCPLLGSSSKSHSSRGSAYTSSSQANALNRVALSMNSVRGIE